jgi:hypothetical protein
LSAMNSVRRIFCTGPAGMPNIAAMRGHMKFQRKATSCFVEGIAPIRIARGALEHEVPSRDLYVSGAHCLYINDVLVPAAHVVNGTSIQWCRPDEFLTLEYYHIELASHDVVLANGAPAETFAGGASRRNFDNFQEYVDLYGPNLVTILPFAPVVGNHGGRQELRSRIRSVLAPIYDRRLPLDVIRDEIASRAEALRAA